MSIQSLPQPRIRYTGLADRADPRPRTPLRIALVCMPWASLDMPSLALSTLAPTVESHRTVARIDTIYANIRWADYIFERSAGEIDSSTYLQIVDGYYVATGEWIFSPALYGDTDPLSTQFYQSASAAGADLSAAAQMHRWSRQFVEDLAEDLTLEYDLVGLTSTFDQNMPTLALARAIKARRPDVMTVMGGANCDDVQGQALHRNFETLDYVVRGEGELVFPRLLDSLADLSASPAERREALKDIPGLCWRDGGVQQVNRQSRTVVAVDRIPEADLSGYFKTFRAARVTEDIEPKIQIEGGRGCWWGEKHHCTFCGLNGTSMAFRAKSAERVLQEIENAVRTHNTLDVVFADNIMAMGYIRDLMPALAKRPWDLRLFFEVKSNLDIEQIRLLAEAGVAQVQPGIESLSTPVLKLMDKGVTGWQNVRMLRDSRTLAVYPGWNILYGFPGETGADYEPVIEQMASLHHLTPPEGCYRVVLTRFSPFFDNPALGMNNRGPSGLLRAVYQLPTSEIADIAYIFESDPTGISEAIAEKLDAAFTEWRLNHAGRRFVALEDGAELRIIDERTAEVCEHRIRDGAEVAVLRATLKGRTATATRRAVAANGFDMSLDAVTSLLEDWTRRRWLFRDEETFVALTTGLSYSVGATRA